MSVKRRRAKKNERALRSIRLPAFDPNSDWVKSGRIACSYGTHDGNPCSRCGAEYSGVKV